MNKPYVICHMLTSVDGKIDGDFFSVPECAVAFTEYANLREAFDCSATLYGTMTMLGGFSDGLAENIPHCENPILREDYQAPNDIKNSRGIYNYHGGGNIVFDDNNVLDWIISHTKQE